MPVGFEVKNVGLNPGASRYSGISVNRTILFVMALSGAIAGVTGALLGVLHFSRLPAHYHPLFSSERFERATDDRFFISIEAADPRFDRGTTVDLLTKLGSTHVELVEH